MITISTDSTLQISGSNVKHVNNLIGCGHEPSIKGFIFSGSSYYLDTPKQYLREENESLYGNIFSCDSSSWKPWSIFLVVKPNKIPNVESGILSLVTQQPTQFNGTGNRLLVFVYMTSTQFKSAIYSDGYVTSNGNVLGTVDTNTHVIEISANGSGTINTCFDGVTGSYSDVHPKTAAGLILGAAAYDSFLIEQYNGEIKKVLIYDQNLTNEEREQIRSNLNEEFSINV